MGKINIPRSWIIYLIKNLTPAWFYELRYIIKTFQIYKTQGRCLQNKNPSLVLRKDSRYDLLFVNREKAFLDVVMPLRNEFKWPLGRIFNGGFGCIDFEFYYSMIRKLCPHLIIEIGSGHSTLVALEALKKNNQGSLMSIDPLPRRRLPSSIKHLKSKVEDVDPTVFESLQENDILFIDSSHTKSEALYHVNTLLPRLEPGVIIHHHDIMYPYMAFYEEEEVVLDFYSRNQEHYQIICGLAYVSKTNIDLIKNAIPSSLWDEKSSGGSLWIKKTKK